MSKKVDFKPKTKDEFFESNTKITRLFGTDSSIQGLTNMVYQCYLAGFEEAKEKSEIECGNEFDRGFDLGYRAGEIDGYKEAEAEYKVW